MGIIRPNIFYLITIRIYVGLNCITLTVYPKVLFLLYDAFQMMRNSNMKFNLLFTSQWKIVLLARILLILQKNWVKYGKLFSGTSLSKTMTKFMVSRTESSRHFYMPLLHTTNLLVMPISFVYNVLCFSNKQRLMFKAVYSFIRNCWKSCILLRLVIIQSSKGLWV